MGVQPASQLLKNALWRRLSISSFKQERKSKERKERNWVFEEEPNFILQNSSLFSGFSMGFCTEILERERERDRVIGLAILVCIVCIRAGEKKKTSGFFFG